MQCPEGGHSRMTNYSWLPTAALQHGNEGVRPTTPLSLPTDTSIFRLPPPANQNGQGSPKPEPGISASGKQSQGNIDPTFYCSGAPWVTLWFWYLNKSFWVAEGGAGYEFTSQGNKTGQTPWILGLNRTETMAQWRCSYLFSAVVKVQIDTSIITPT